MHTLALADTIIVCNLAPPSKSRGTSIVVLWLYEGIYYIDWIGSGEEIEII